MDTKSSLVHFWMVWWRHISTLDTTFAANWFHPGGIVGQPTRHLDLATRVYSGCHVSLQFGQKGLTLRNISNENRDKYVSLHVPHIFLPICLVCCTKEVNSLLPWSSIPSSFSFFARVESYLMGIVINPTSIPPVDRHSKGLYSWKWLFEPNTYVGHLTSKSWNRGLNSNFLGYMVTSVNSHKMGFQFRVIYGEIRHWLLHK